MTEPRIEDNPYFYKWYDVDTNKITSIKDVEAVFCAIGLKVGEDNKNFDKVKHLLIIPEEPKTLEEISQELDEKINALIKTTKEKFECSNYFAGKRYKQKFDKIIENFEYAKKNGEFPPKLTLGSGFTVKSSYPGSFQNSFVIRQGDNNKGYYTIGNQRFLKYYMPDKPNAIVRFFMKTCLGFVWVDEENAK